MSELAALEIQYRHCLAELSVRVRLMIEHEWLCELQQNVIKAQQVFDDFGGRARLDSIQYYIDEGTD